MSWLGDHYGTDEQGNLDPNEIDEAVENGDLIPLDTGRYWDPVSRTKYGPDGTKCDF